MSFLVRSLLEGLNLCYVGFTIGLALTFPPPVIFDEGTKAYYCRFDKPRVRPTVSAQKKESRLESN